MNTAEYIRVQELAALKGVTPSAVSVACARAKIILRRDSGDARRKYARIEELVRRGILSNRELQSLVNSQIAGPRGNGNKQPGQGSAATDTARVRPPFERNLPFPPAPPDASLLAPPGKYHDLVMRRLSIAIHLHYELWKVEARSLVPGQKCESKDEFVDALARKLAEEASPTQKYPGFGVYTIQGIERCVQRVMADDSIPSERKWAEIAQEFTPGPRPGRSKTSFYAKHPELADSLIKFKRKLRSVKRAHEALCDTIPEAKLHPTFSKSRTFLENQSATATLRGRAAVKVSAGYLDRHYDDEFAGDAWCLDEWQLDGVFYDEQDRSRLFNYGEKGPIAHVLSAIDERTTYIMDWILTWNISLEGATLELAERTVRRYWLPIRLVTDRAGRCRALSRQGRVIVRTRGEFVDSLMGPLGELGVKPRGSEEENPRGNRIERALHREYARRAVDFGVSWKGANTKEREGTDIDARVKRHLREHCKLGTCGPQLLSIQSVEHIVARWVNELNTCETRAKGCHGLTRLAAFNQFRPTEFEIARRKPGEALLDLAFAERDQRTIQPGGVIELKDGKRYSDFDLVGWVGEKVEVLRYRRDPSTLQVFAPGQEGPVIAHLRRAVGTNEPDVLSEEIAKLQHARKVLAREETPLPAQGPEDGAKPLSIDPREFFSRPEAARETGGIKPLSYFGDDA